MPMCVLFIRSYDDLTFRDAVKPLTKPSPKNLALLQPLDAPRGLTAELVARLTADITSGKLPPGSRLPTEQEMIAATGVSRTVGHLDVVSDPPVAETGLLGLALHPAFESNGHLYLFLSTPSDNRVVRATWNGRACTWCSASWSTRRTPS